MHFQLKITLQDIEPPIWRRVFVPRDFTLFELHHVIQIAMGWEECHLHDFTIKRQRYVLPPADDLDDLYENETCLCDVVRSRSKFLYQYDFGDGWNHDIVVEKVVHDAEIPGPSCVDGARACPPEDSGGPWGYQQKLEAIANPDDEETEELREWMDPDFDSELFNVDSVNKELRRFFRPTRSSKPKK